jgi:hypothetical protein
VCVKDLSYSNMEVASHPAAESTASASGQTPKPTEQAAAQEQKAPAQQQPEETQQEEPENDEAENGSTESDEPEPEESSSPQGASMVRFARNISCSHLFFF